MNKMYMSPEKCTCGKNNRLVVLVAGEQTCYCGGGFGGALKEKKNMKVGSKLRLE